MNTPSVDIEKLLIDCRAAHAFLDRIECQIHKLIASSSPRIANKAPNSPQDASEGVYPAADTPNPTKGQEGANLNVFRNPDGFVQYDMFPEFVGHRDDNSVKSSKKQVFSPKKGCPTLTRKQVLANFNKIVQYREQILDLAEVNKIFGYNKSTGGSFIKHAVKRGELGTIPCGKTMKFLALDVRAFIKSYFDSIS